MNDTKWFQRAERKDRARKYRLERRDVRRRERRCWWTLPIGHEYHPVDNKCVGCGMSRPSALFGYPF